MEEIIKMCQYCGGEMRISPRSRRRFHDDCGRKHTQELRRARERDNAWKDKQMRTTAKWAFSDKSLVDRTPVRHNDIAADARAAREAGLTYGQWRALQMQQRRSEGGHR